MCQNIGAMFIDDLLNGKAKQTADHIFGDTCRQKTQDFNRNIFVISLFIDFLHILLSLNFLIGIYIILNLKPNSLKVKKTVFSN